MSFHYFWDENLLLSPEPALLVLEMPYLAHCERVKGALTTPKPDVVFETEQQIRFWRTLQNLVLFKTDVPFQEPHLLNLWDLVC